MERSPIAAEFMVVGETKIGKLLTYDLEVMKNILRNKPRTVFPLLKVLSLWLINTVWNFKYSQE